MTRVFSSSAGSAAYGPYPRLSRTARTRSGRISSSRCRSVSGPGSADTEVPPVSRPSPRPAPSSIFGSRARAVVAGRRRRASSLSSAGRAASRRSLPRQGRASKRACPPAVGRYQRALRRASSRPSPRRRTEECLAWYLAAPRPVRARSCAVWDLLYSDFDALIVPPAMTTAFTRIARGHSASGRRQRAARVLRPRRVAGDGERRGRPALVRRWPGKDEDPGCRSACEIVGLRWSEMLAPGRRPRPRVRCESPGSVLRLRSHDRRVLPYASSNQTNVVEEDVRCWSFVSTPTQRTARSGGRGYCPKAGER